MPIFEYSCNKCSHEFEELVFSRDECPPCPSCGSEDTGKLMSACKFRADGATPDTAAAAPSGGAGGGSAGGDTGGPSYKGIGSSYDPCAGCSGGDCSSCS
ncbi:MAG: FmdB family zinc ribbon protein [Desulfovibrio sp.]